MKFDSTKKWIGTLTMICEEQRVKVETNQAHLDNNKKLCEH